MERMLLGTYLPGVSARAALEVRDSLQHFYEQDRRASGRSTFEGMFGSLANRAHFTLYGTTISTK